MSKLSQLVIDIKTALTVLATKDDIAALNARIDALTTAHGTTTATVTDTSAQVLTAVNAIADSVVIADAPQSTVAPVP